MCARRVLQTFPVVLVAVLAGAAPPTGGSARAEPAPRSFEASPEVYKVVAERDRTRVILVTWAPRQQDRMHSHPAITTSYFLTGCRLRFRYPDGRMSENSFSAGNAFAQAAIAGHSVENIGDADCRVVMTESD